MKDLDVLATAATHAEGRSYVRMPAILAHQAAALSHEYADSSGVTINESDKVSVLTMHTTTKHTTRTSPPSLHRTGEEATAAMHSAGVPRIRRSSPSSTGVGSQVSATASNMKAASRTASEGMRQPHSLSDDATTDVSIPALLLLLEDQLYRATSLLANSTTDSRELLNAIVWHPVRELAVIERGLLIWQ